MFTLINYIAAIGLMNFILRAAVALCALFLMFISYAGLCFIYGF